MAKWKRSTEAQLDAAKLVGFEMDRFMSNFPAPTANSQTLLSNSPFVNTGGAADYANSSLYQAPSRAWVFATGTSSWRSRSTMRRCMGRGSRSSPLTSSTTAERVRGTNVS